MFNQLIANILPYLPKKLIWIFSKRYIAGSSRGEAVYIAGELNSQGMMVTFDILGEFITQLGEAVENKRQYLELIEVCSLQKINCNYSVKPTMFGLLIDEEVCYKNIREIVQKAQQYSSFVRIDMEDSQCTGKEIALYRKLKAEFPKNTGLVVQAYLKRTLPDLTALLDVHSPQASLNFRLCKGIYVEAPDIAYKNYDEINAHYLEDLEFMFRNKIYVGIATHDKYLVENAYRLIEQYKVPPDRYEFQMLYGVTPELRQSILDKKHRLRVYVPYGEKWFGYSIRRLKENPKMVNHIIKALFFRG